MTQENNISIDKMFNDALNRRLNIREFEKYQVTQEVKELNNTKNPTNGI